MGQKCAKPKPEPAERVCIYDCAQTDECEHIYPKLAAALAHSEGEKCETDRDPEYDIEQKQKPERAGPYAEGLYKVVV